MPTEALFRSLEQPISTVTIEFDGVCLEVPATVSLAAALISAGIGHTRTTAVSAAPRAAFCMMGVCFDCLVEIDGVSRQACQVMVRSGLQARSHHAGKVEENQDD